MIFAAAIDGDSGRGNHLSEPKRCSDKPGHLTGALGARLAAIEQGVIVPGPYLLVESSQTAVAARLKEPPRVFAFLVTFLVRIEKHSADYRD